MEIIPKDIKFILEKLEKAGFEAFLVGGCVRDLILENPPTNGPKDWDIATNARPEQIQKVFPDSLYENKFGTVTVLIRNNSNNNDTAEVDCANPPLGAENAEKSSKKQIQEIQITTYRTEQNYSDRRHPDKVEFADTLEEDLSRRDFTMNAIALKSEISLPLAPSLLKRGEKFPISQFSESIIDPFNGQKDIKNKIIRAVGNPNERFSEDALRMMRAVRFSCQLDFQIEEKTKQAIKENARLLTHISNERIRDELAKIILSDKPAEGIETLQELNLLKFIVPELEIGIGVAQNRHHIYTIYQHSILSLKYCPSKKLEVRLAALLHDIAKPQTKQGEGATSTFYNHDYLGAKFTKKILQNLKFSNETIEKTSLLVRNHMFFYNVGEVSEAGVRRLVKKIGKENVRDLINLRIADRLGSGVPKAKPYKLRHLEYMIEKVSKDPISLKMLKIDGNGIMKLLDIQPGPKIGSILDVLFSEVLDDPEKNTSEYLEKRAKEISALDLLELRKLAKEKIEERKEEENETIRRKHWIK
ncbi:MAG: HD domain-containing protein [bacterium]